jgi:NAD(P)-dependent dehydrogenase (short-subunit alcohol dehydrogenase family)
MAGSNSAFLAVSNEIVVKASNQGSDMTVLNQAQPLQGQSALVIRSDSTVGAVIAEALAAAGAKVMLNYLEQRDQADQVAQRIRAKQGQAMIFQADVTQETQVRSMFDVLIGYWGSIDILVTNASLELKVPLLEMTLEQGQQNISNNLTGHFLCAREAAREFLRRSLTRELSTVAGKIISVSVEQQCIYQSDYYHYAAYKSGMDLMKNSLAQTLYKDNIHLNSLVSNGKLLATAGIDATNNPAAIAHAVVRLAADQSQTFGGLKLSIEQELNLFQEFTDFNYQPDALADQINQGKL